MGFFKIPLKITALMWVGLGSLIIPIELGMLMGGGFGFLTFMTLAVFGFATTIRLFGYLFPEIVKRNF